MNPEVNNILAAVFDKKILDPLLEVLNVTTTCFWATEGTAKYLIEKGFSAKSVVSGFDFDGRVKSLDKTIFARVLADKNNPRHLEELRKIIETAQGWTLNDAGSNPDVKSFDAVIVDLYEPDKSNFPESMDIGGQAMIRAAVKNYQNVALAFDEASIKELADHLATNQGSTLQTFRKEQAKKATRFIAQRCKLEVELFSNKFDTSV